MGEYTKLVPHRSPGIDILLILQGLAKLVEFFFHNLKNDGSMGWKVNIYLVIFPIFPITHDKCRYLPMDPSWEL